MMKNKKQLNFNDFKLSTKMSIITGIILALSLTILIGISALQSSKALATAINGEFSGIAATNGLMVQSIITEASGSAKELQDYFSNLYNGNQSSGDEWIGETKKSHIYHADLTEKNYVTETYVINTALAALNSNEDLYGICLLYTSPSPRDCS